ncbi:MAG TPA: adenosylmethionine--8-amino-7-oxononanoate transaminase [Puia sp.]|jgi:adenosylmethionine-8-amino-7-oxononanoate aminotransferase|nr:adenosylmethionine--8-amino-7-oxononanoate transaminase [Puia sp.]
MKESLSERDIKVIWHPYTQHQNFSFPIPIVKGEGALLFDEDGNSYIDAISSWWVNLHGHANPYIAEKIFKQALSLEQVIFTNFTHEPAVLLAERLIQILPEKPAKIFFSDNGSTAVEVALKMAIQFWLNKGLKGRNKILVFEHAYHGDTFGAMSVSGRGLFTDAFRELLFDVIFIETPDAENLDKIKSIVEFHKEQIAAFIYEPLLQAAGGMRMYEAKHMDNLLGFIRSQEILCIADEVLTGFGRTGTLFASESIHYPADMTCLSKGLTGGFMPLGVTACSQTIFDAFLSDDRTKTFFHGHSYTANPLACTAGLASLDLLLEKSCLNQINEIRNQHEQFVQKELSKVSGDYFLNIRILGTVLAFELNSGKNEYTNQVGTEIMNLALLQGIYVRPLGNTVYLMPPYCINTEQLKKIYRFILEIPFRLKAQN